MRPPEPGPRQAARRLTWLAIAVVAAGVLVRLAVDLATPLVPKVNGAYYLVQVRSLLETGRLSFSDFPPMFVLEAGLAALLSALGVAGQAAILAAVKTVDIVLPALAALPLLCLSASLGGPDDARRWPAAAAGIFGVLSWSPVMMAGDFQKNAAGMLAMAGAIALVHGAMTRGGAGRWIAAAGFLAMAGLSHVGAFAAALTFAVLAGCIVVAVSRPGRWKTILAAAGIVACAAGIVAAVLWVRDRVRLARMAGVIMDPFSLFRRPLLIAAFEGAVRPIDLLNALLVSAMSALGLATLVRRWRSASTADRAVIGAASGLGIVLASPLMCRAEAIAA
jgi:hypothetical protein